MKDICVIGYPKSGNTWLSRLLGEALNCPVTGYKTAKPLATEGLDRESDFFVRQLHLKPVKKDMPLNEQALVNAWWYDWRVRAEHLCLVHIVRDVRDIIVSAHYYWQRAEMWDSVRAVLYGHQPLEAIGPWADYVMSWVECPTAIYTMRYEDLLLDPYGSLFKIFERWDTIGGFPVPAKDKVVEAVQAQSFEVVRARIEQDGGGRPYGKTIQLRNLRKGVAGDWVNHLKPEHRKAIYEACLPLMKALGYHPAELDEVLAKGEFPWH